MGYKKLKKNFYIMLYLCLIVVELFSQSPTDKKGGICFRVDDNQAIKKWEEYAGVFDKYKYNFTFALNVAGIEKNIEYIELVKRLVSSGHELADHTPNHTTLYFTTDYPDKYTELDGVDHISGNKIALKYDSFDTTNVYPGDGSAVLYKNMLISKNPGQFKEFNNSFPFYFAVYLPTKNIIVKYSSCLNTDTTDVDTLYLKTLWDEQIELKNDYNVQIKILSQYDIRMNAEALRLLIERSIEGFINIGVFNPKTWIQPGGTHPQLYPQEIKNAIQNRNYIAAAVYPNAAIKCYNEYDPKGERRYAMQWGDFYEDLWDLKWCKKIISDKIARHYVLIGHSHFSNLLGGWDGYLARMDSLLNWCKEKNILVKTYSEWSKILYDTPQNPIINIIPPLSTDLDEDGLPDGYSFDNSVKGFFDDNDGVEESGYKSFSINSKGRICYIDNLAGLEKGENDFFIWTKGGQGDSIEVKFYSSKKKSIIGIFKFPATTSSWTRYSLSQSTNGNTSLVIPYDISHCDIDIDCTNYSSGIVKISGMLLRKKIDSPIKIVSFPVTEASINKEYNYMIKVEKQDENDTLVYELIQAPNWMGINQNGLIAGVPTDTGKTPVRLKVTDKDGFSDEQFYILSIYPERKLEISTNKIIYGSCPVGITKDTNIFLYNIGLDTLTIQNFSTSSYLLSINLFAKKIPPRTTILSSIKFTARLKGNYREYVYFYYDSINGVDSIEVNVTVDDILDTGTINNFPSNFYLAQNYPNPFNSQTTFAYGLMYKSIVRLEIYNILGQLVRVILNNSTIEQGSHYVIWDGMSSEKMPVGSGIYFVRLIASPIIGGPSVTATRKILLIR